MDIKNLRLAEECITIKHILDNMREAVRDAANTSVCGIKMTVGNRIGGVNTEHRLRETLCKFIKEEQERINEMLKEL